MTKMSQCGHCEEVYIGATARPFRFRFREYVNSTRLSTIAVGVQLRNTRHALDLSSPSIVVRVRTTLSKEELERLLKFIARLRY